VFERFTKRAPEVVALAQEEARSLGHDDIVFGWLLFAIALGVGIAIGWAIWG
jgi:hypothetical protein